MTDKVPKDAIFQPQPEDAKGAPATTAQMKMITDAYYGTASQGRDTLFDRLKRKFPDTHPPRRAIQRFLNRQSLQQRYSIPRKSTQAQPFRPVKPFHSLSIDLIDFSGKPARNYVYVLNAVENFSRFQWLVPLTGKDSWKVAKATKKVLDEIQSK